MARDFTEAQFRSALSRNGFKATGGPFGDLYYQDTTGACPNTHFGAVVDRKTVRVLRRATLASLIRGREQEVKRAAARAGAA